MNDYYLATRCEAWRSGYEATAEKIRLQGFESVHAEFQSTYPPGQKITQENLRYALGSSQALFDYAPNKFGD